MRVASRCAPPHRVLVADDDPELHLRVKVDIVGRTAVRRAKSRSGPLHHAMSASLDGEEP
jgi:hypothetical protein